MFDESDLDHRLYGSKTPIEALQSAMDMGFAERDKAVREVFDKCIQLLKNICRKGIGFGVNAAG